MRGLALNGGGARGLITLQMLKKLEKEVGSLTEYFSIISGTSTGAIIAAGISVGMTISEIEKMYIERLPLIFKKPWYRFGIFQTKYSNKELKKALQETFGDLRIVDAKCQILLPALNGDTDRVRIFKRKDDLYLWEAVLASASAPTYFPMTEVQGEWYKDGGLSHNNPSDILFKEFLSINVDCPTIYNFSTGCTLKTSSKHERNRGLYYNISQTIDDMFVQQDLKVFDEMTWLQTQRRCVYFRNEALIIKSSGKIDDVRKSNLENMISDGENSPLNINKKS